MPKSNKLTDRRSECPIAFGLDLFGDKWTLLILRDMLFYKITRFSDFAVRESISTNILAERLSRLENAGIITKEQDKTLKNQNIYYITDKGRDLLPILIEMSAWGLQYDEQTPVSKTFVRRLATQRKQIAEEITDAVKNDTFEEYRGRAMGVDPINNFDTTKHSSFSIALALGQGD